MLLMGKMTGIHADQSRDPQAPRLPERESEWKRLILGTWHDDYQGKRTMTLREDGTGIMIVELSGLKAKLYASRLEFDMTWSLENRRLKKKTVGGRPSGKVKLILATMGNQVNEPILELTQESLVLLDADGETKYHWRRVKSTSESE